MISVPRALVDDARGHPASIHSMADTLTAHGLAIAERTDHVTTGVAALERMSGSAVRALRHEAEDAPPKIAAAAEAYDAVARILNDYAEAVAENQTAISNANAALDDDAYQVEYARTTCLASAPDFPGYLTEWNTPPSFYTAPDMEGLGSWHAALDSYEIHQHQLDTAVAQRTTLDEDTARRLREVTTDVPALRQWMHTLGPLANVGLALGMFSLKAGKAVRYGQLTRDIRTIKNAAGATASGRALAAQIAMRERMQVVTGTGPLGAKTRSSAVIGLNRAAARTAWAPRLSKAASTTARVLNSSGATRAMSVAGRVAGPIGAGYAIVDGVDHLVNPRYDGARGITDQAVGAIGAAGGVAALGAAAGVLAIGVAGPIVLGAGLVVGAWALGNAIYDNWDSITATADAAWEATTGVVSSAWNAGVDNYKEAAAKTAQAGAAAVDAVSAGAKNLGEGLASAGRVFKGLFG